MLIDGCWVLNDVAENFVFLNLHALHVLHGKFKFFGSHTSQWTQIGNAVPPIMAKEIGRCLIKMYFSKIKVKNKNNNRNIEYVRSTAFNYGKDVYETENKQTEMSFTF